MGPWSCIVWRIEGAVSRSGDARTVNVVILALYASEEHQIDFGEGMKGL